MTQPPATDRLTAGELCLAEVSKSPARTNPFSSARSGATHARIDLIWEADSDRNHRAQK